MKSDFPLRIQVVSLGLLLWAASGGAQIPPSGTGEPGVLLLHGGQVFQGNIALLDSTYIVTFPNGQMRFRAFEVEHCCATLGEVYQRKRAATSPGDWDERLRLAQWCMKQGLLAEAGAELDVVATAEPQHPLVGLLRQRLDLLRRPPAPAKPAPLGGTAKPHGADLDRMVRALPDGAMENFALRVQPVLVNHCATAGCHGPAATSTFQLLRVTNPHTASRRATQQNLLATLPVINPANPAASPLLNVPLRAHGPLHAPIFPDPQSSAYRRLAEWVLWTTHPQGSQEAAAAAPTVIPSATLPGDQTRLTGAFGPLPPAVTLEGQESLPTARPSVARRSRTAQHVPRGTGKTAVTRTGAEASKRENESQSAAPSAGDPFDPELFNRRFAPNLPQPNERRADAGTSAPTGSPPAQGPR